MLYAHYCDNKTLRVTTEKRPVGGKVYAVTGRADARKLAERLGATPWNF